jgi:hypothetical protein
MKTEHQLASLSRSRRAQRRSAQRGERISAGIFHEASIHTIDDKAVIRLLRSEVNQAGGQASWARRERIELTMLNKVLCGHRPPTM